MDVDVLIIGGGIAGLWTLDQLRRSGYRAVLVENRSLGFGQTIASQGIIHGGLKYSLRGAMTASAAEIREMPTVWRQCLNGQQEPNLSQVQIRDDKCFLWQTAALSSQAGMWGAQINLRVKPEIVTGSNRPKLLQQTPGNVYQLNEQVLSPSSLLQSLKKRNQDSILLCDQKNGIELSQDAAGQVNSVAIHLDGEELYLTTNCVVMSAGIGNQLLNELANRKLPMQTRPLQMVLARGELPMFQGHCIDGAKTRVTITSEKLQGNQVVWQLGGQIAEQGATMQPDELIAHAAKELQAVLPGLETSALEFATYQVDRAEKKVTMGLRPDSPQVIRKKNILTCWPTKLAFAPRAASMIENMISKELNLQPSHSSGDLTQLLNGWATPQVAGNPWETVENWYQVSADFAHIALIPAIDHAA